MTPEEEYEFYAAPVHQKPQGSPIRPKRLDVDRPDKIGDWTDEDWENVVKQSELDAEQPENWEPVEFEIDPELLRKRKEMFKNGEDVRDSSP